MALGNTKDTVGHNAPSLSGLLISLVRYADDLIIMSITGAGLERQHYSISVVKGSQALVSSGQ